MKKKIASLALLTIMLVMPMTISLAKAETWVEVGRWTGGTGLTTTGYFNIAHEEWRIRYNITLSSNAECRMDVYEDGEEESFALIYAWHENSEGTVKVTKYTAEHFPNIHSSIGVFHIDTILIGEGSYLIIVEQDVDSIPEFTPITLIIVLTALSIFLVALSKKLKHNKKVIIN